MEYWCRKREYRYSTDAIEYDVEHHEQRFSLPDYSLPHCGGFLAATIANQDTDVVFHCLDVVGGEEEYYQCQEQQLMTELRSHYPDIAIACASKVANTFMEVLRIANASHRCPKRNSGGSSTLHMLYFKIHPRTSLLPRQYAEELIVAEGCGDEDEDAVFPPRQRPATRASIAALLTAASGDARQCQCGICMEDMETTQRNTLKLPCSHSFHRFCLVQWLDNGHSCPICRYQMPAAQYRSDLSVATD